MAKNANGENEVVKNESVEKVRTALAELALEKIDDLKSKRVSNPDILINALANLYNSIK